MYYHIFLIPFIINRHLGCFPALAIMEKAAMNSLTWELQRSLWDGHFTSLEYKTRHGIAGSYSSFIFHFSGTSVLFSIVAALTFSIRVHHTLLNTCYPCLWGLAGGLTCEPRELRWQKPPTDRPHGCLGKGPCVGERAAFERRQPLHGRCFSGDGGGDVPSRAKETVNRWASPLFDFKMLLKEV